MEHSFIKNEEELQRDNKARLPHGSLGVFRGNPYVRYILGFIGFISLLVLMLAVILWREHEKDLDRFTEITDYHLFSELKLERMTAEIGLLENAVLEQTTRENPVGLRTQDQPFSQKLNTTIFAVNQFLISLKATQERFQGRGFGPAFHRLESSVSELSETAARLGEVEAGQAAEFVLPIETLKFRVAQLDRLHSAAYEELLAMTTDMRIAERQKLAIIAVAMVLAVLLIAYLTVRRVDRLTQSQKQTEIQLASALSSAEKANAAKTDFLTHMSHDLRTPLNSILGFSQMMKVQTFGPLGDSHYEEYAKLIHHSGERLVSMVNDVLDFARIESGEYHVNDVELNLTDQAKESFQRCLAMPFADTSKKYRVEVDQNAPTLYSDERAISQILDNLVSNALKYAGDKASISILWGADLHGNGVLQVKDTGLGIPERQLGKVMEPFVQGGTLSRSDPHIARTGEGVGLGLHIVVKLATILGAEFLLDSIEGQGTTASVIFPAKKLR